MRLGWNAKDSFNRTLWVAYLASLLFVSIYVIVYWFEPFTSFWNNFFSNFFPVIASLATAVTATLIWRSYDKTDAPRRIWGPFMLGLWMWLAAEISWGVTNMIYNEVPLGLSDVLWVTSYGVLGLALYFQYQVLFNPTLQKLVHRSIIAALFVIGFTMLLSTVFTSAAGVVHQLEAAVDSFYPVVDLLLAVIALKLARNFAGGAFSRPWMGLIVFAIADLFYAWLEISGTYTWSVAEGNLYSTIADVTYVIAYLVMWLSLLYHWLFLKYGMRHQ
jgi:hypothetical protein